MATTLLHGHAGSLWQPGCRTLEHGPRLELTSLQTLRLAAVFLAVATMLPLLLHLHHDYLAFLALGPGGTPSTVSGFVRVKILGLFAIKDPYRPLNDKAAAGNPNVNKLDHMKTARVREATFKSLIHDLPVRFGPRPMTRGIAPQRQVTQRATPAMYAKMASALQRMGASRDDLIMGSSCFEPNSIGLLTVAACSTEEQSRRRCGSEIAHLHPSDGSLHVTLHPCDLDTVLRCRWGERHPLARGGWLERFVPENFVLVYAPRDDAEVEVIMKIIDAAAALKC